MNLNRRQWMQAASAAIVLPNQSDAQESPLRAAGQDVEILISPVSAHTFRITVLPVRDDKPPTVPTDGSLVQSYWGEPIAKLRRAPATQPIASGNLQIKVTNTPLTFVIATKQGDSLQRLTLDPDTGVLTFLTGDAPLLGLGEGGPQFDRRGATDRMRSGQGGYQLRTHGGRVPIPWIVGTSGWAIYIHQPFGTFDFTGAESK
ncbi:MAG TPA: glycoside hydrolase, partial [Bryobacteraceae bacterium]|nr:glycoside hydrolase [Bryobacteraceae bacterium]